MIYAAVVGLLLALRLRPVRRVIARVRHRSVLPRTQATHQLRTSEAGMPTDVDPD
jgi:hypothetical protein